MSSDEKNISAPLYLPAAKQNGNNARRFRRKRRVKHKKRSSTSRVNHPLTSVYLPTSKQNVHDIRLFLGPPDGCVKSISESENILFNSRSSSLKFHMNSKPQLYTLYGFNSPISHCHRVNRCHDNNFQSKNPVSYSFGRTSKQAACFDTNKLILDYIRNSRTPINTCRTYASSTISSAGRSYHQPSNFQITHSTPEDHSALEDRSISACSTMAEVGSMKNINSSSSIELSTLSESSQSPSPEMILLAPPNSLRSQTSSNESWDSEDDIKSINQSCLSLNSDYSLRGNFQNPKSVLEENDQNNTALKNEYSSKTSVFPVWRQLQIDVPPSSTSAFPLRESKRVENATGSLLQISPYSAMLCHPKIWSSNNPKETNILEENGQGCASLASDYSSMTSSLHPEESLSQAGEFLAAFNSPESLSNSKESCSTEDAVECVSQSFAFLSAKCGPPIDAAEISSPSNEPNLEQRQHNRKKKKSKLISCFTSCCRSSSPRQGQT